MSRERYEEDCPGCRPAIIDAQTGRVLPDDDPVMVDMLRLWKTTTRIQRQAFHRVMCLNSREPDDLTVVRGLVNRLQRQEKR